MTAALTIPLLLAAAAGFADLDAIDREVARFTGAAPGAPGGAMTPVDRRLRLAPCPAPLALSWRTARRESVVVQCPAGAGWRLFVPVAGAVPGTAAQQLPAINRGEAVTIAIRGEGFSVSRPGEAAEGGAIGAWIKVRTPGTTRGAAAETLRAQVVRPGLVTLDLP